MEEPNPPPPSEPSGPPPPPPPEPERSKPAALSPQERLANLDKLQHAKRRRGFLIGIVAGQLLVLALVFGGELLLYLFRNRVRMQASIPGVDHPLRVLVFLGMTAGIVATGLMVLFVMGLQGMGYVVGKKKVGFFTAVGRGIKRCFKAAWSLGLTLGVIGGTAWFLIPRAEWGATGQYMEGHGRDAVKKARAWAEGFLKAAPKEPPPPAPSENP